MKLRTEVNGRVVIGVDGSPQAGHAREWGAAWAASAGLGVTLVCAAGPGTVVYAGSPGFGLLTDEARKQAERVLERDRAAVQGAHPALSVETALVPDAAAEVLVSASETAALTVIGTRGLGGVKARLLGGVADQVVTHAAGPVAVVPEEEQGDPGGPIVVGVAGHASRAAVQFALATAQRWGRGVLAVHAWPIEVAWSPGPVDVMAQVEQESTDAQEEQLATVLADDLARFPDVRVERRVVRDRPDHALISASKDASLVVVGSRGRSGFAGLLLGSTSRRTLQLAHCPAVVVRSTAH